VSDALILGAMTKNFFACGANNKNNPWPPYLKIPGSATARSKEYKTDGSVSNDKSQPSFKNTDQELFE
jgi:hypothetical protein